jgi:hypothetical protein
MQMLTLAAVLLVAVSAAAQPPAPNPKLTPPPAEMSGIRLRLEPAGQIPTPGNPTSPFRLGSVLVLVDQAGFLYRWDKGDVTPLLTPKAVPVGITPIGRQSLLNAASDRSGSRLFVVYLSSTVPNGVVRHPSPRNPDSWYVVVEFRFDGTALTTPRPIVALQARSDGHLGGGMTVDDDGAVLLAIGDNGDAFEDGREHGQAPGTHLGKILRIAPADGSMRVAALGVRSPQRLAIYRMGDVSWLTFTDPGGWVSEEVNAVPLTDLKPGSLPNFGWGRQADGKGREGTFEIDARGNASGRIGAEETRFVPPVSEYGRPGPVPIAVSGPTYSASFSRITLLFGDLVSGKVYVTTESLDKRRQLPREVSLVTSDGKPTTLRELAGQARPDPRFFTFPDGAAGILLERTGVLYRVTEVP